MAQVDAGAGAPHLDPAHAVGVVLVQGDGAINRAENARPAGATPELVVAAEQPCARDDVDEPAAAFLIEMRAGEGTLGALLEGEPSLLPCQDAFVEPGPKALFVALVAGVARDLLAFLE